MGILDDFEEAVSDGIDAAGSLIEGAVEAGEEGVEEVGKFVLEEILGFDVEGSDGGSPSEGHDYDQDYNDTSDELQIADLIDPYVSSVREASTESIALDVILTDDIYGTIDDAVTEPDATHLFDDVAGTVTDIVIESEARPLNVAEVRVERTDFTADSIQFIPAHTPDWTNFNDGDPSAGLLEAPSFLVDESLFAVTPDRDAPGASYVELSDRSPDAALPDLEGTDTAIVADSIQLAGATVAADNFESMQFADDRHNETTQAFGIRLTEDVSPALGTTFEDASPSLSFSWLF